VTSSSSERLIVGPEEVDVIVRECVVVNSGFETPEENRSYVEYYMDSTFGKLQLIFFTIPMPKT
jgi:hypothetical protein